MRCRQQNLIVPLSVAKYPQPLPLMSIQPAFPIRPGSPANRSERRQNATPSQDHTNQISCFGNWRNQCCMPVLSELEASRKSAESRRKLGTELHQFNAVLLLLVQPSDHYTHNRQKRTKCNADYRCPYLPDHTVIESTGHERNYRIILRHTHQ